RVAAGSGYRDVAAAVHADRLDWIGLAGLFSHGFFPDDRTHYDEIRQLRPACGYRWTARSGAVGPVGRRYWSWARRTWGHGRDEAVDELGRRLGAVMADLGPRPGDGARVALPLSGGLDSRSTLAALGDGALGDGAGLWTYGYGYGRRSIETRIGRRLARRRGLDFHGFEIGPYLFDRLSVVAGALEGFQDVIQARQVCVSEELAARSDVVIAAHWGDVWLDGMGVRPDAGDDDLVDSVLRRVQKRGRRWLLDELVRPHLGEDPDPLLRRRVGASLEGYRHLDDPDLRLKAWKTDHWSARWTTASLRAFQVASFPRLPFYSTRLTDFLTSLPTPWLSGRGLQIDYLKRFAPDLARVRWQAGDANLYLYPYRRALLPVRAVRKLGRLLRRERVLERNWEVQLLGPQGRRGLESRLLAPGLRLHDLVPPARIRPLVERFLAEPTPALGYTVSMLLSFGVWLEGG
ncbi:MAG: hypothetical protein AAGN66_15060, partial [Acidobacteriota bacterium]